MLVQGQMPFFFNFKRKSNLIVCTLEILAQYIIFMMITHTLSNREDIHF